MIWDQMVGPVNRAHTNDIKLPEVDDWEGTKPRNRKGKMRKATLVEPGEFGIDEGLELKEGREICQQPVKRVIRKSKIPLMNVHKAKR